MASLTKLESKLAEVLGLTMAAQDAVHGSLKLAAEEDPDEEA